MHVLSLSLEEIKGRPLFEYREGFNDTSIPNVILDLCKNNKTGGMKFEVSHDNDTDELVCHVLTRRNEESTIEFDSDLLQFVFSLQELLVVLGNLHVFAEHTQQGVIFHARPNF